MASPVIEKFFYNSCLPVEFPCTSGEKYIDPCSCSSFYQCVPGNSIRARQCSQGTGFHHVTKHCDDLSYIVLNNVCDQKEPWERCPAGADEDKLERRCNNLPDQDGQGGGGGVDGGVIAGVVIALLLVVIIAVLLIIYIRKKGNPIRNVKESGLWRSVTGKGTAGSGDTSQSAARYRTDPCREEETYAEIDDTALYKDPSGGNQLRLSLSHTNETYDRDGTEAVAYDNPALTRDTPPPPEVPQVPPEYSGLEMESAVRSYASLNEHSGATAAASAASASAASRERGVKELSTGEDGYLVAEAIGDSTSHSAGPSDPNYFVLEKSQC